MAVSDSVPALLPPACKCLHDHPQSSSHEAKSTQLHAGNQHAGPKQRQQAQDPDNDQKNPVADRHWESFGRLANRKGPSHSDHFPKLSLRPAPDKPDLISLPPMTEAADMVAMVTNDKRQSAMLPGSGWYGFDIDADINRPHYYAGCDASPEDDQSLGQPPIEAASPAQQATLGSPISRDLLSIDDLLCLGGSSNLDSVAKDLIQF